MIVEKSTQDKGISGQATIDGTAVQLNSSSFPVKRGVYIKADADNGDVVYVGFNAQLTTDTGFVLKKGEFVVVEVDDLNKIWVIGGDTGQLLSYLSV